GSMVLNTAKLGENLKGVVSFHGGLAGVLPKKGLLKANILVCHGEADTFVLPAEVAQFKKSMDSVGADYTFKSYPNATHAFSNPEADQKAKKFSMPIAYNAAADTASWNDMKTFFGKIFGN
ncbi:MAG TPA: dienelactone hydrolase family protein, partial [Flavitalea sp.]|nr:dienelactone hydrolase family protein [Flavitalea sp.]